MKRFYIATLVAIVLLALLPLAPLVRGTACVGADQQLVQAISSLAISAGIGVFVWPVAAFALVLWIIALMAHLTIRRSRRRRAEHVA